MDKLFINVAMGTGGNIALSSFITAVKEKYPGKYQFYVCSPYFDIFESNENVDGVYKPEEVRDFIFDCKAKKGKLILHRLYDMDGFVKKQLTYPMAWAELCGIKWEKEKAANTVSKLNPVKKYPYLKAQLDDIMKQVKENGFENFIIVNFEGGVSPLQQVPVKVEKNEQGQDVQTPDWSKVPDSYENEQLARHYKRELAQEFCDKFREAHPKTAIINYSLPNQGSYNGTFKFVVPYLVYYELAKLPECLGIVAIDSSLQHLVAGVTKGVIIWGHSSNDEGDVLPFGYSYYKNIIQPCRRDDILFFSMLGASAAKVDYIKPDALLTEVDAYLFNK